MTQRLGEYKIKHQAFDHELWETHFGLFFSEINSFDSWNEKRRIEIQANPLLRFNLNMKGIFLTASTDRYVYRNWLRYGHTKRPKITTSELEIQKLKNGQERGFFMKHKEIIIMVTEDQKWLYIEASARKTKRKLPLLHLKIWQMTLEELLEKTLVLCSYKFINAIAIWDTLYGVLLREYDIKYDQLVALKRLRDLWTLYDHEVFERTPEYEHTGYDYQLNSACKRDAYKDFYSK